MSVEGASYLSGYRVFDTETGAAAFDGLRLRLHSRLDEIGERWRRLTHFGAASVFQQHGWVQGWNRTIGATRGVHVFAVEVADAETDQPLLLLPLVRRQLTHFSLIEMPDFGLADYVGPIVAKGFAPSRRQMRNLWTRILEVLPAADAVRFVKMPAEINGQANPLMLLDGVCRSHLSAYGTRIYAPFEHCEQVIMPQKKIDDLNARWRKLNKRGRVAFHTAETPEEADRFFEVLCAQRAERFTLLSQPNALDKPEIRNFFRNLLTDGSGAAVIQALTVDDEVVATGYGLVGNGAFHMIFPTFRAEKWRNYSPGMHLFRKSMAWAAENKLTYYDFTVGAEGFKRDFGAKEMPLFERYEALTVKGVPPVAFVDCRRLIKAHPRLAAAASTVKSALTNAMTLVNRRP